MPDIKSDETEELPDSILECVHKYRWGLLIVFALSWIAYGFSAFNILLNGDDLPALFMPEVWISTMLQVGRWGQVLIWELTFHNRFAPTFTLSVLILSLIGAALVMAKPTGVRNGAQLVLFAALLTFCPVLAEVTVFKTSHMSIGIGLLLAAISVRVTCNLFDERSPQGVMRWVLRFLAIGCLTIAIACQQSIALFAGTFMAAVLIQVFHSTVEDDDNSAMKRAIGGFAFLTVAASIVYVVISYLVRVFAGLPEFHNDKYKLTVVKNRDELFFVINRFIDYFKQFLFGEQHLWPLMAKYCFLLAVFVWLVLLVRKVSRKGGSSWVSMVSIAFLVSALFAAPWVIGLLHPYANSYHYTALLGLLPLYPAIFAQGSAFSQRRDVNRLFLVLGWVVVAHFMFYQNVASLATYMINRRDLAVTERMLSRIESHPDYRDKVAGQKHAILLIGKLSNEQSYVPPFGHSAPEPMGFSIVQGGVYDFKPNRFIWFVKQIDYPYKRRISMELKSENLQEVLQKNWFTPEHLKFLHDQLQVNHPWPAGDAILIEDNVIFVVMSKPERLIRQIEKILESDSEDNSSDSL